MSELTGWIREIYTAPGGIGMSVQCAAPLFIQPGQYCLAYAPALQEILPTSLFIQSRKDELLHVSPPIPSLWQPGLELKIRGPFGNGFTLPADVRNLALVDYSYRTGSRLLSLAETVIAKGGEVALLSDLPPENLSAEIELLSLKSLAEAFEWADYLAVDLPFSRWTELQKEIETAHPDPTTKPVEVLLDLPLICAGNGSCGLCSVYSDHKWKLACKDGPVFPLASLAEGE